MSESAKEISIQRKTKKLATNRLAALKKVKYDERKYQTPIITRSYGVEPAPPMVVVFGPPSSGKTLFMNSIVRCYTKQKIQKINGIVTLMAAKSKRLSFYECPADLPTMADTSKVADLVILIIDAVVGLEIETFEMLNLLRTHGFPKIMCVVTKVDMIEGGVSKQRSVVKKMKKRLWTEVCNGIKVIPMSKVVGGRYLDRDIIKASRYITQMKYRPFMWRSTHPYIVADQLLEEENKGDLNISVPSGMKLFSLTGYVRGGIALKKSAVFHLPGIGDYSAESITVVNDPCPLTNEQKKKLSERKKPLYAPTSDIRGMLVEQDAVYLDIKQPKGDQPAPVYTNEVAEKPFSLFAEPDKKLMLESEVQEASPDMAINKSLPNASEELENISPEDVVPDNCMTDSEDSLEEEIRQNNTQQASTPSSDVFSIEHISDTESDEMTEEAVKMMFKTKQEVEEDYIERFNDKYIEEVKDKRDIFTQEKEKIKDAELATQGLLDRHSAESKEHLEGIAPGRYVKLMIVLPMAVSNMYTPENIFILGANKEEELSMTFIQGRVKRHKWFKKTLKTKEAHYISMGWRRFQTTPIFSLKDAIRNRILKYIPDSMTCNVTFYAPTHPPGTSFTILRKFNKDKNFRIAANGVQCEIGGHPRIMKKLKLIGYPSEIKGHTVFVKDMFHTQEEAARYEGAMLKTVSGLRGQIKKAGKNGVFRASFEGVIKMSEIIFLPCFFPITPSKVYLNAENFADAGEIKLLKEIRDAKGIQLEAKSDSVYREIEEPKANRIAPIPKSVLSKAPLSMLKKDEEKEEMVGSEETIHKLKLLRTLSFKVEKMKEEKQKAREDRINEIIKSREEKRKVYTTKMKTEAMINRTMPNKKHKTSKTKDKRQKKSPK
ncbi:ribosome biogenesis protein BMS1 [Nematocida sp. ERTm5]|nr:ribosome biogenesis protein BMS1 [Nematocida sp. ERTm5]